jgi:hypothetical protein
MKVQLQQPNLSRESYKRILEAAENNRWSIASAYGYAIEKGVEYYKQNGNKILMTKGGVKLNTLTRVEPGVKQYINQICQEQNIYIADFIRWAIDMAYK